MAESYGGGGGCCRCCTSFILTSGLTALFMWLSLRTYKPTCSIQEFYLPSLNTSSNSTSHNNHTISLHLKLDNQMKDKGVHYNDIYLTIFYNNMMNSTNSLPVANYTLPEFYQGHGKEAHRKVLIPTTGVMPWETAAEAVSNGTVRFRVGLKTRVKFKIMFWYTKRHSLVVGGDVEVNGSGGKVKKKGIKLKSGAADDGGRYWLMVGPGFVSSFLIVFFL